MFGTPVIKMCLFVEKEIHIVQINCQKSKIAAVQLMKQEFKIALVTEPCKRGDKLVYVDTENYKVFSGQKKPRAAILISRDINAWEVNEYTDKDMAVVMVKVRNKNWIICSLYLDINLKIEKESFIKLLDFARKNSVPMLIGTDSNSHSVSWGAAEDNTRGGELEDLINVNKLHIF